MTRWWTRRQTTPSKEGGEGHEPSVNEEMLGSSVAPHGRRRREGPSPDGVSSHGEEGPPEEVSRWEGECPPVREGDVLRGKGGGRVATARGRQATGLHHRRDRALPTLKRGGRVPGGSALERGTDESWGWRVETTPPLSPELTPRCSGSHRRRRVHEIDRLEPCAVTVARTVLRGAT